LPGTDARLVYLRLTPEGTGSNLISEGRLWTRARPERICTVIP